MLDHRDTATRCFGGRLDRGKDAQEPTCLTFTLTIRDRAYTGGSHKRSLPLRLSRNMMFHDVGLEHTRIRRPMSSFVVHGVSSSQMRRPYRLKRRAEAQRQTRHRIIEAAIELHQTIGPAATTVRDIAKRARVGRVTVYRHFDDELALARACSGQYFQRHPLPDADPWSATEDPTDRLRIGLRDTYAYHRATEKMMAREPI